VQPKAAADKPPKVERKENVLDASRLDALKVDTTARKPEDSKPIASVTAAAS